MIAMEKRGFRVIALAPREKYAEKFAEHNIEFIEFAALKRSSLNPFNEIITIFKLARVLRSIKPDFLHCFTIKPNLYGSLAGKIAGVKKIYITITGLGSFFISEDFKAKIIRKIILLGYKIAGNFTAKILFQNRDDYKFFTDRKIVSFNKAIIIGSSGLDTAFWQRSNDRDGNGDRINILFVGRLIAHKGIFEFLEAAEIIKDKYKDKVNFIVVGGADLGNKFAIKDEDLDRYKDIAFFAGEQKDIKPFYEKSDIFVLPSYREGISRAILEAESMELAIITSDATGCKDAIIENVTGLLTPIKNSAKLAEAIDRLISDSALRKSMQKAAREHAKNSFDIKFAVEKYIPLYEVEEKRKID
jgi:N,N'-diacetylbacillosaminyl-diphospho-undecaprenol alpha-1,3-N-acetylgalactosaminyltransferase